MRDSGPCDLWRFAMWLTYIANHCRLSESPTIRDVAGVRAALREAIAYDYWPVGCTDSSVVDSSRKSRSYQADEGRIAGFRTGHGLE